MSFHIPAISSFLKFTSLQIALTRSTILITKLCRLIRVLTDSPATSTVSNISLCNVCSAQIKWKVNIPNELEQIKCSVYGNEVDIQATDLGTLIEKIGIAAAVKVRSDYRKWHSPLIANDSPEHGVHRCHDRRGPGNSFRR